ncbi:hypothetical protein FDN13_08220 [Caloramator sp. E03]|uniref:hypothetical protein n=1 Tax=Caloramator sp. E03 TaxID=2576307 RepID=UPI00111001B1|nr:hypothetical protein [Caloramator sp. E03]QCX33686.1 hypothetical protein FDN13_08220 [Caloramator sp. E03]
MKKFKQLFLFVIIAILLVLIGCDNSSKAQLYFINTTLVGQVTAVKDNQITLKIISNGGMGMGNMNMKMANIPPSMPNNETANSSSQSSNMASDNNMASNSQPQDMPNNISDNNVENQENNKSKSQSQTETSSNEVTLVINNQDLISVESNGQSIKGNISSITKNSILEIKFDENNTIVSITVKSNNNNFASGMPGGGSSTESSGTGANTFNKDTTLSDKSYTSSNKDENVIRVENSAKVNLNNVSITKTGDSSSSENSDFYGLNAGILARDKSTLTIKGSTVSTNASGSNGVFAYGSGTSVNITDTKIRTQKGNSGGIEVAGGATLQASNLDIETQGASSAAIRSDRGGGTLTVKGGSYVTNGTGSPAIYCTANISVDSATLTANGSEAVVIEGKNSVKLNNCIVTGNMKGTYGENSSENIQNVMIYQSMSGDASIGKGSFTMTNGSLIAKNGDMFYVTNTSAEINLTNVSLTYANGNLLTVSGNDGSRGWGKSGSNGGTCEFIVNNQLLEGYIKVDKISSLNFSMKNGSKFKGTINSKGQEGSASVTLDNTSTWTLTGNAYITEFNGSINNIITNGYHVYVNGKILK